MTNQINFHGDIRSVDEGFHQTAIPDPILIRFEFLIFSRPNVEWNLEPARATGIDDRELTRERMKAKKSRTFRGAALGESRSMRPRG